MKKTSQQYLNSEAHGYLMEAKACTLLLKDLERIRAKLSAQHSGNLPGTFFVQRIKLKGRVGGVKRFVRIVQQLAEHAAAGSVVAVNQGIGRSGGVWRGKAAALIQKQRSGGGIQSVKPAAQVITVVCLNHRVVNVGAVDAQPACCLLYTSDAADE